MGNVVQSLNTRGKRTRMAYSDDENTPLVRNAPGIVGNGNINTRDTSSYEELFKDSEPCPTCRGLGRVTKEQKGELVALIPLKDKRLKPRRTVQYVVLAIVLCAIVAALILFFLYPRDVNVGSNRPLLNPISLYVDQKKVFANLTIVNSYNFTNNNYFPVEVTGAQMVSLYDNKQITVAQNKTSVDLPTRGTGRYDIVMNLIFEKENDWDFLVRFCEDARPWVHNLPITFELTANYSYLGHIEQTTLTTFQPVSCSNATEV
ncbi:transmembrane protein 106B-like isoform X1 [Haliotis rubra]|uniref:transmembrane protein 106B-like isoform X1 n=2 Tax=Haliotis rubra TaxID=36100 RepID=UPI001EE57492|nr:transmembrane protein 106B-like isoform X1 [Haliotis rubra]